jgi:hypothetical protein
LKSINKSTRDPWEINITSIGITQGNQNGINTKSIGNPSEKKSVGNLKTSKETNT